MVICHNPSLWEVQAGVSHSVIPSLIDEVYSKGGKTLIYKSEYIDVLRAIKNKEYFADYCKQAVAELNLYKQTTNDLLKRPLKYQIDRLIYTAAGSLCLFNRCWNLDYADISFPLLPEALDSEIGLSSVWIEGYRYMAIRLYGKENIEKL